MSDLIQHLEFLTRGGFMMVPLLLSALISLIVVIERVWLLKTKLFTPKNKIDAALLELSKGQIKEALQTAKNFELSPVMNVVQTGCQDLLAPLDEVEISMQNEAERWVPVIEKRLEILDTIITAAPLMGLLGTITGMMSSFQVLSEKGVNEPGAITGGVSEALIATATGLVIALLTLIAYNYLNQVVKNMIFDMESAASQVIQSRKFLLRQKT